MCQKSASANLKSVQKFATHPLNNNVFSRSGNTALQKERKKFLFFNQQYHCIFLSQSESKQHSEEDDLQFPDLTSIPMSSSTSGRDLSDPFLAFAFHLRSSPLSPDWLGLFALEWHPAGEPDYAQVVLAAREVALLYRGQALVFPQQDRSPPRLWLVAPEDLELAPPADLNLDLDATSGASGDPCRTQAFLQTQAPRQDDRGKKVRPLRERLAALGLRLVKVEKE